MPGSGWCPVQPKKNVLTSVCQVQANKNAAPRQLWPWESLSRSVSAIDYNNRSVFGKHFGTKMARLATLLFALLAFVTFVGFGGARARKCTCRPRHFRIFVAEASDFFFNSSKASSIWSLFFALYNGAYADMAAKYSWQCKAPPPHTHTPRDGISPFLTCIQINPSAILVQEFCISAISALAPFLH